jgi:uncharacterized protein
MKYLFWAIVIAFVYWAWRRSRSASPAQNQAEAAPQDMVACAHCGIHLPHTEAIRGTNGQYCSTAHRSAAGDRNPD